LDKSVAMSTPKKRLDTTIVNLAARVEVVTSPKGSASQSPRRTTGYSKTSSSTPTRTKVQPCEKGENLYNKICKGLITSSRTPTKQKALTPSKFFKSRSISVKIVKLSVCDKPQAYITDIENLKKVGGKSRSKCVGLVETVMPLFNIKSGSEIQDHVEIVTDIVDEVFEKSTLGKSSGIRMKISEKTAIRQKVKANAHRQDDSSKDVFSSLLNEEKKPLLHVVKSRKRKGSPIDIPPSKKRNDVVFNSVDSSDEDDAMFISTKKPILSEDDKKEMDQVLGVYDAGNKLVSEAECEASKGVIDGRRRKEGAQ